MSDRREKITISLPISVDTWVRLAQLLELGWPGVVLADAGESQTAFEVDPDAVPHPAIAAGWGDDDVDRDEVVDLGWLRTGDLLFEMMARLSHMRATVPGTLGDLCAYLLETMDDDELASKRAKEDA